MSDEFDVNALSMNIFTLTEFPVLLTHLHAKPSSVRLQAFVLVQLLRYAENAICGYIVISTRPEFAKLQQQASVKSMPRAIA